MRKVIAAFNMTLDGVCDHTTGIPSEDLHQHYSDLLNNTGVILYGRTTYELMQFWKTILQNPPATLMTTEEEHNHRDNNRTASDIEKFGLSVIIIEATDYLPSFAYSIGLWQKFKHPEIICFGLRNQTLLWIINNAAEIG